MVSDKDHTGVSAMTGTPQEIQGRLSKSHASHVVAITFDHPGDALTLRNLSKIFPQSLHPCLQFFNCGSGRNRWSNWPVRFYRAYQLRLIYSKKRQCY